MSTTDTLECGHTARSVVTCGACGLKWCEGCDPAPSALCPRCNGRGYTTAEQPGSRHPNSRTKYYDVFVRNWWRRDAGGRIVPAPGARKTSLARHVTYEDARAICEEYNSTHKPGPLSRKAEFTEA